jgi:hypothetical protein
MKRHGVLAALAVTLLTATAIPASDTAVFNRVASFPVELNAPDAETGPGHNPARRLRPGDCHETFAMRGFC